LIKAAYNAADAALMTKAFTEWVANKANSTNTYDQLLIGLKYVDVAEFHATLTGDQQVAAAMHKRGSDLIMKYGDSNAKQTLMNMVDRKIYPSWWPRIDQDKIAMADFPPKRATDDPDPIDKPTTSTPSPTPTNAAPKLPPVAGTPGATTTNNPPPAVTNPPPPTTTAETPATTPPALSNPATTAAGKSADKAIAEAEAASARGDTVQALKLYDQILAADPSNAKARFNRGSIKLWSPDSPAALEDFRELVKTDPTNLEARRIRALLEIVHGDRALAEKEASALLEKNKSSANLLLAGQAALYNNRVTDAQSFFQQANAADPRTSESIYTQAGQLLNARSYGLAYLSYSAALGLNPGGYTAYYGMGMAASQLGWKDQAIGALEQYLRHDGNSQYAVSAREELRKVRAR
jgi:thioredoxin-like negative regulator of GroEL